MKIALAQLNYHIGNFEENIKKILQSVDSAKSSGADIVCFSELATCGYPPRDFLEFDDFIRLSEASIESLRLASKDIAIVIGAPTKNPVLEGKDLYNSVYFIYNQEIQHFQHKALLPTYDVFDEYRYFEPGNFFSLVHFKGKKIALTICEDIWNIANENPMYTICPIDEMIEDGPDFVLNVSASPFHYTHVEDRLEILKANVERYKIPFFYVNHVGAQTELIFAGGSVVMSPNGNVFDEMIYFQEDLKIYDLEEVMASTSNNTLNIPKMDRIHDAIILGIKDYFKKLNFKKAILGLSGGIDSAVSTVLAVRALGKENVRVLLMPSQFSSDHSVNDARALAENLGIQYDIINIQDLYDSYIEKLNPLFEGLPFNVTEENIQARSRGMLLMAMSNKFGSILLNTTNKSEMAVGYGTLYGDLCGGISVIADVYKSEVFELAEHINNDGIVIPLNTISKPPSAELRPDQKDSDSLPDYDILDEILYLYIEKSTDPQDIIALGHDEKLVKRILRLVNINEFKRYQTAPVLRVSSKAFGVGRRMPIVGKYLS